MKEYEYNPGHYVFLYDATPLRDGIAEVLQSGAKPAGFVYRYPWADLELPNGDGYATDEFGLDLDFCADLGLRLIPMLKDKTFSPDSPVPIPAYLMENLVRSPTTGGWSTVRWNETVGTRFCDLISHLYSRFGQHLALEGIALQETAPSISSADLKRTGYSPERYRDLYKSIARAADAAASTFYTPKKRLFWHANFFPGDYAGKFIAEVLAQTTDIIAYGSPDLWPTSRVLQERVFPIFRNHPNRRRFIGVSRESFSQHDGQEKLIPLTTVAEYGRDNLGVNYLFWNHVKWNKEGHTFNKDAVPIINTMELNV